MDRKEPKQEIILPGERTQEVGLARQRASAEIDIQIATAHQFPRRKDESEAEMMAMATKTAKLAKGCAYGIPRKSKDGRTTYIVGPSIRFAEIVRSAWGNMRTYSSVIHVDARPYTERDGYGYVIVSGAAHDLQKNVAAAREVREKIQQNPARGGVEIATLAAQSKAIRNAILEVVPKGIWEEAFEASQSVASGSDRPMKERREAALAHVKGMGVEKARMLYALGVTSMEDITEEHLTNLRLLLSAIKEGAMDLDGAFPDPKAAKAEAADRAKEVQDALREEHAPQPRKKRGRPKRVKEEALSDEARKTIDDYLEGKTTTNATLGAKNIGAPPPPVSDGVLNRVKRLMPQFDEFETPAKIIREMGIVMLDAASEDRLLELEKRLLEEL